MTQKTLNPSDMAAIVAAIDPDAHSAGDVSTPWISTAHFQKLMAVVQAGVLGASATLDAKIEQATDASGTGAKDLDGAAIAQLTKAGSDDSKQAVIEFAAEDLDIAGDYNHVRLTMSIGTATSDAGALLLAMGLRYLPASDYDAASVAEIVTV